MIKQALFDVLIVIVAPIVLMTGYLYLGADQISSIFSTALMGVIPLPGADEEMGTKSKVALNELNSINFDESLFVDPTFASLYDFTGTIATSSVGRKYPFSLPDEVATIMKKNNLVELKPASMEAVHAGTTTGKIILPKKTTR